MADTIVPVPVPADVHPKLPVALEKVAALSLAPPNSPEAKTLQADLSAIVFELATAAVDQGWISATWAKTVVVVAGAIVALVSAIMAGRATVPVSPDQAALVKPAEAKAEPPPIRESPLTDAEIKAFRKSLEAAVKVDPKGIAKPKE